MNAVAVSPDGGLLVTADENGAIFVWEAAAVHLVHSQAVNTTITALAFTADSKTLAIGDDKGDLMLWQIS